MPLVRLNLGEDTNNGPHAQPLSPPDTTYVAVNYLSNKDHAQFATGYSAALDPLRKYDAARRSWIALLEEHLNPLGRRLGTRFAPTMLGGSSRNSKKNA
jgi:hypothetical protein